MNRTDDRKMPTKGPGEGNGWPEAGCYVPMERFSDRTLRSIAALIREIIFSQEYTARPGWMQRLDPRVKLVTILAVIVTVSLCRRADILAEFYTAALLLAVASRIPLMFFIKRVWIFIPLFSGIIALPALVLVPGVPLFHLGHLGGWDVSVTRQGAESALIFVLRVATSVSFVVLLTLTTKWPHLLRALRAVFVPSIFVFILGITYRYIFHLLNFVEEMHTARKSRTLTAADARGSRRWVAGRMGFTLSRTMRMGDEIYEAMVSRGFTGDVRFVDIMRPGFKDIVWTLAVFCAALAAWFQGGFR